MKKPPAHNEKIELIRFLSYFFVAVMVMLVVSEVILLLYWHWHPSLVSYQDKTTVYADHKNSLVDASTYKHQLQTILYDSNLGQPYNQDTFQSLRDKVSELFVPKEFKDFHFSLMVKLDECLSSLQTEQKENSLESAQQFDKCREDLNNFIQVNTWLQVSND